MIDPSLVHDVVSYLKAISIEISLLRKQIEKLDRTVEKLNSPVDVQIDESKLTQDSK